MQFIYEITDKNYEKPIILRSIPYLSRHLSGYDGIIGVYLNLNKDLMPAIQVRFAAPMTEEKLWKLMTMEEEARISFKKQGKVYEY